MAAVENFGSKLLLNSSRAGKANAPALRNLDGAPSAWSGLAKPKGATLGTESVFSNWPTTCAI